MIEMQSDLYYTIGCIISALLIIIIFALPINKLGGTINSDVDAIIEEYIFKTILAICASLFIFLWGVIFTMIILALIGIGINYLFQNKISIKVIKKDD